MKIRYKVSFEIAFETDDSWHKDELEQLAEEFVSEHLPEGWTDKGLRYDIFEENVEELKETAR